VEGWDKQRRCLTRTAVQSLSMKSMAELMEDTLVVVRQRRRSQSVPVGIHFFHRCVVCLVEEGTKLAHSHEHAVQRHRSPVVVISSLTEEEEERLGRGAAGSNQLHPSSSTVSRALSDPPARMRMIRRPAGKSGPVATSEKETTTAAAPRDHSVPPSVSAACAHGVELSAEEMARSIGVSVDLDRADAGEEEETEEEEDLMENCSLMEYETIIKAESRLEALEKIKCLSDEFEEKIGGIVTVAAHDTPITPGDEVGTWQLKVKWALPVLNFENCSTDPNEVAMWLLESVPPSDPNDMGSKKGVFMDVDRNVLRRLLTQAVKLHS